MCCAVLSHSVMSQLFATPWTAAHQPPLSMGFSRQEYWSGLLCPPPGDRPHPGIKPGSPALQAILHQLSCRGSPLDLYMCILSIVTLLSDSVFPLKKQCIHSNALWNWELMHSFCVKFALLGPYSAQILINSKFSGISLLSVRCLK